MTNFKRFLRGRLDAFPPAFEGWVHVWRTTPNAWIYAAITVVVIAAGAWVGLDRNSWIFIVLAAGFVWVTEFLNTALEAAVDLASPRRHRLAKAAKDASAGAVVIAALVAVIVGLLVLGPPLWGKIF